MSRPERKRFLRKQAEALASLSLSSADACNPSVTHRRPLLPEPLSARSPGDLPAPHPPHPAHYDAAVPAAARRPPTGTARSAGPASGRTWSTAGSARSSSSAGSSDASICAAAAGALPPPPCAPGPLCWADLDRTLEQSTCHITVAAGDDGRPAGTGLLAWAAGGAGLCLLTASDVLPSAAAAVAARATTGDGRAVRLHPGSLWLRDAALGFSAVACAVDDSGASPDGPATPARRGVDLWGVQPPPPVGGVVVVAHGDAASRRAGFGRVVAVGPGGAVSFALGGGCAAAADAAVGGPVFCDGAPVALLRDAAVVSGAGGGGAASAVSLVAVAAAMAARCRAAAAAAAAADPPPESEGLGRAAAAAWRTSIAATWKPGPHLPGGDDSADAGPADLGLVAACRPQILPGNMGARGCVGGREPGPGPSDSCGVGDGRDGGGSAVEGGCGADPIVRAGRRAASPLPSIDLPAICAPKRPGREPAATRGQPAAAGPVAAAGPAVIGRRRVLPLRGDSDVAEEVGELEVGGRGPAAAAPSVPPSSEPAADEEAAERARPWPAPAGLAGLPPDSHCACVARRGAVAELVALVERGAGSRGGSAALAAACRALAGAAAGDAAALAAVVGAGGVAAVCAAMGQAGGSEDVQAEGCRGLRQLAACGEGRLADDWRAAAAAVVRAMAAHGACAAVQAEGCGALGGLARSEPGLAAAVAAGAVAVAVQALLAHPGSGPVQHRGCAALRALAEEPAAAGQIGRVGGMLAVLGAVAADGAGETGLRVSGLSALEWLCRGGEARRHFVRQEGAEGLVAAMRRGGWAPAHAAMACAVLGRVCRDGSAAADRVFRAGGVEAVLGAMAGEGCCAELLAEGCGLLGLLSIHGQACAALGRSGALAVARRAAARLEGSPRAARAVARLEQALAAAPSAGPPAAAAPHPAVASVLRPASATLSGMSKALPGRPTASCGPGRLRPASALFEGGGGGVGGGARGGRGGTCCWRGRSACCGGRRRQ